MGRQVRIVDDQGYAERSSRPCDGGDGETLQVGEGKAFGKPQAGARVGGRNEIIDRGGVAQLDAEAAELDRQITPATVQGRAPEHDVVPGLGQR